jgi:plastocyanin
MKWFAAVVPTIALGAIVATTAFAAAPRHAMVTIHHQTIGCHAWALGSGPYTAHVNAKLAAGGTITFTDNDVMSHQLIKKSGLAVTYSGLHTMKHMGATLKVTFPHAGIYRFTTKAGEDYMQGVKTIGEDNVLTLTVTVR